VVARKIGKQSLRRHFSAGSTASKCFVIDADRPVNVLAAFGREIKELEHGRANDPLVTDQRLNDFGIVVARARNQFAGAELSIEVAPDLSHPRVVPFDRSIGVLVLQFDPEKRTVFEGKKRALQARMNQTFNRPDIAVLFFVAGNDFCFGAIEDCFDARGRIVPTKPKRRQKLLGSMRGRGDGSKSEQKKKRNRS